MPDSEFGRWWRKVSEILSEWCWPGRPAFLWVVTIVLATQALEYWGWLASANGILFDLILRKIPAASDYQVVTIAIDDDAYNNCLGGSSPMDPESISRLVNLVHEAGAGVIGVDIFTDSEKPQYAEAYRKIAKETSKYGSAVIWAAAPSPSLSIDAHWFGSWLMGAEDTIITHPGPVLGYNPLAFQTPPPVNWALPVFPRDDDGTIRRLPLEITVSDPQSRRPWPQFARLIASEYCAYLLRSLGEVCPPQGGDEVLIPYGGQAPGQFTVGDFFYVKSSPDPKQLDAGKLGSCPGGKRDLRSVVENRAVLIGGTFGGNDFHDSPRGRMPGVRVLAYAVQAQIGIPAFYAVRQPYAWLIDFGLGFLFSVVAEKVIPKVSPECGSKRRVELVGAFAVLLVLLGFFSVVFWVLQRPQYIPGMATVLVGVLIHQSIHAHKMVLDSET